MGDPVSQVEADMTEKHDGDYQQHAVDRTDVLIHEGQQVVGVGPQGDSLVTGPYEASAGDAPEHVVPVLVLEEQLLVFGGPPRIDVLEPLRPTYVLMYSSPLVYAHHPHSMYSRKDLLDKYGLEVLTADRTSPSTFEDHYQAMTKISEAEGIYGMTSNGQLKYNKTVSGWIMSLFQRCGMPSDF